MRSEYCEKNHKKKHFLEIHRAFRIFTVEYITWPTLFSTIYLTDRKLSWKFWEHLQSNHAPQYQPGSKDLLVL